MFLYLPVRRKAIQGGLARRLLPYFPPFSSPTFPRFSISGTPNDLLLPHFFSLSIHRVDNFFFVYFWSCSLSWHLFLSRPISLSPLQSLSKYFGLGSLKFYPKISSSCPKCTQYWLRFSTLYFSRCAEKEELVTLTGVVGGDLVNRESDKLPQPFDREKID